MIIPHLTENYGASRDPPEKQAPMCTVHSFPHNIDHCLTWARSEFEGLVEKTPTEVNAYLSNPVDYTNAMTKAGDAQSRDTLERVLECLEKEKCETFQDCITWARLRYPLVLGLLFFLYGRAYLILFSDVMLTLTSGLKIILLIG
jgi:ubiquitin-activating enzyme E1